MFLKICPSHLGMGLERRTRALEAIDRQGAAPYHLGSQPFILMPEFTLFVDLNVGVRAPAQHSGQAQSCQKDQCGQRYAQALGQLQPDADGGAWLGRAE